LILLGPRIHSLSDSGREDAAESRGGDDQRSRRTIFDDETEDGANQAAETDGGHRIGEATKRAGRALMIFSQRPHALRTCRH